MTDQVTVFEPTVDPGRVARETAWQLRKTYAPPSPRLWLPGVLLGCSVALQTIALVAALIRATSTAAL